MNTFGINASQLVSMIGHTKSEGKKAMKIVLVGNGLPMNPMDCKTIDIKVDGDTTTISWVTTDEYNKLDDYDTDAPTYTMVPLRANAPSSTGIVAQDDSEVYCLEGADLADYNTQSPFLNADSKSDQLTGAQSITIETKLYNILELDSVTRAVQDLIIQEKSYLSKGIKVVKNEIPRYIYQEDGEANLFKLVKVALIID